MRVMNTNYKGRIRLRRSKEGGREGGRETRELKQGTFGEE
jgi:hypothetical protein